MILDTFEHDFKEMLRKSLKDEELAGDNQKHCENCKRKSELTIKKSKFKHLAPIIILRANRFSKNNKNKIINRIKIEEKLLISDILSSNSFNEIEEEIIPSERDLLKNSNFKKINFFSNPLEINDLNEEISSKKESNSRESKEKALLNNDKIHLKEDCYSLYCIIFHKGVSNECGHYFSLLKDFRDGAWFLIDDQNQHIEKKDEDFEFPPDETPYIFYYMRKNLN